MCPYEAGDLRESGSCYACLYGRSVVFFLNLKRWAPSFGAVLMPRFYFDISPGAGLADTPDQEGSELEGLSAARIEAVRL